MNIPLKAYWQLFSKYLRPQRGRALLLALLLLLGIALRVVNPQIIRGFLDAAQNGAAVEQLWLAGGVFLAFALLVQVLVGRQHLCRRAGWLERHQ